MYGFMVNRDESVSQTNVIANEVQLRIKPALVWLRNNNPLFQSFNANYDTLYRFDPDKVLHYTRLQTLLLISTRQLTVICTTNLAVLLQIWMTVEFPIS